MSQRFFLNRFGTGRGRSILGGNIHLMELIDCWPVNRLLASYSIVVI